MSGDKLQFFDYRKSKLEAGEYKVEVTQQYGNPKQTDTVSTATSALTFRVTGDQLRLLPEQLFAQYPPSGEGGDFADTLPHIALNKASLPWERSAYIYDDDALYSEHDEVEIYEPWFYLMVINDDDISRGDANNPETRKLGDMIDDAIQDTGPAYLPQPFINRLKSNIEDNILSASEEILTIDVKASFFRQLIADRKEDLQYLAHVRERRSESDMLVRELSVIMANRFAQGNNQKYPLGMANYAMLVSLEQYLNDDSRVLSDSKSLYVTGGQTTGTPLDQLSADAYVRLVILTHWSFTSKDNPINFEKRSQALDAGSLRLPSKHSSTVEDTLISAVNTFITANNGKISDADSQLFLISGAFDTYISENITESQDALLIQSGTQYKLGFCSASDTYQEEVLTESNAEALLGIISEKQNSLRFHNVLTKYISTPYHPFIHDIPKRDSGTVFDHHLKAGMTALWHKFRLGDQSLSWYHGPLVPHQNTDDTGDQLSDYEKGREGENTYVASDADRLLYCYQSNGMLDASYAAAYELGRFLALRKSDYAKALYQYKRARARHITLIESDAMRKAGVTSKGMTIEELPYAKLDDTQQNDYLAVITQYLIELASLKDIPDWYLIPDHRLVPQLTIRTFTVDMKWMQSLWLGALSLASRPQITYLIYQELLAELQSHVPSGGFFLHSDLVWAYPELVVEAKYIAPNFNDGLELNINQLRATHGDGYTDYIEQVPNKGLIETREMATDCQLVPIIDYVQGQCVKYNNTFYECLKNHRAGSGFDGDRWQICPVWSTNHKYLLNTFVTYEGQAYRCSRDHTSTNLFNSALWELTDIYWQPNTEYETNYCVRDGNGYYVSTQEHRSGAAFGFNRWRLCTEWQAAMPYTQEQFVTYNRQAYRCTQNHTSSNSFEQEKWQLIESIDWTSSDNNGFNYIALSLPPEALHYGADATATEVDGETQYTYEKAVKYRGQTICTLSIQADERGIINTGELAEEIRQGLRESLAVDNAYKDSLTDFGSARLSRYMLEGEPKVEFSLGGTK
jgi:hypothetical protein